MPPRPRTPSPEEAALLTVYLDAERYLLETVRDEVRDVADLAQAGADLEARRVAGMRTVRDAAEQVARGLQRGAPARVEQIIGAAAEQGVDDAVLELAAVTGRGARSDVGDTINRGALDRLAAAVLSLLTAAHDAILRTVPDAYRDAVARTVSGVLVGAQTRREAAQRALWSLTDRGITSFTDQGGRNWRLSSYVEMATRTAAARAHVDAQLDRLAATGQNLVIVSDAPRECSVCAPWEGEVLAINPGGPTGRVEVEHGLEDGVIVTVDVAATVAAARLAGLQHPNCFPGDVLVSAPTGVRASDARWYEGDLVVIHTAGGDELPVTPNHPVLTPEGWTAAGSLTVGQHVLCYRGGDERVGDVRPGDEQVPARIREVHDALRKSSAVPPVRVPAAAEQFHGDGGGSEVEVVLTDSLLWDHLDSQLDERGADRALVVGGAALAGLLGGGSLDKFGVGEGATSGGSVRSGDLRTALLCCHGLPLPALGRATIGAVAAFEQGCADGGLRFPEPTADLGLRDSVDVEAYCLVDPWSSRGSTTESGFANGTEWDARGVEPLVEAGRAQAGRARDLGDSLAVAVSTDYVVEIDGVQGQAPLPGGPRRHAGITEALDDHFRADLEGGAELLSRLAGEVATDDVVKIERTWFRGHVYNLQTGNGWYVAGGIVVHNCRHSLSAFIPGVTRPIVARRDPDGYEAGQRQRAIERNIRGWKERAAAAIDDPARRRAEHHVRAWQQQMRQHLDQHPELKRLRYREGPGAGNLPTTGLRERLGTTGPTPTLVQGRERTPRQMSDPELDRRMRTAAAAGDMDAFDRLADETDRRDAAKTDRRERDAERREQAEQAEQDKAEQFERLIDAGVDEEEAVERVYGISVDRQRRQRAITALRAAGHTGKGFAELSRAAFDDHVRAQYMLAEEATNGFMLSRERQSQNAREAVRGGGMSAESLFVGPARTARANASDELLGWWDEHGRTTLEEFRADLLGDTGSARNLRGGRGDFLA